MENLSDPLFGLQGRIALVTGGFGQIGAEFVRALHARGARVAVSSRRQINDAAQRLGLDGADGTTLMAIEMDITDQRSVDAALDRVEAEWGVPTIVVNNAGIDTQPSAPPEVSGPFEQFPADVFREVVETNLVGTFLVTQSAGRRMRAAGAEGSIINIGSIYGMVSPVQDIYAYKEEQTGVPFIKPVAYSAAKSGLYNLTRYCATYWGKAGIRVNTLTPSGVRRDTQDATFQANYTERMPIGRMAEADEYNGALIFLASDASRYMTGSNLVVDGGWTAW
ncbi:SDR family oxidoreductase [uncultured Microbacterium sp.]|uniref:SDR family oxidoreductase n=1 Tax=uncultured Microbacterium sp. TaxID=191216 RepID=UPI002625ECF1|nr:SDR family oxidoreductase [uncultured Microbacterium sp.]